MENVYYDYQTSNKSFLEMSKSLKKAGVKNNHFMLTLLNKDLHGVDPYAIKPDSDEAKMVIEECKKNIWYFLREIARVPIAGSDKTKEFKLNHVTMAIGFCMINNINLYVASCRATHKTIGALATSLHTSNRPIEFVYPESKNPNSRHTRYKLFNLRSILPEYLTRQKTFNSNAVSKTLLFEDIEISEESLFIDKLKTALKNSFDSPDPKTKDLVLIESSFGKAKNSVFLAYLRERYKINLLDLYDNPNNHNELVYLEFNADGLDIPNYQRDALYRMYGQNYNWFKIEILGDRGPVF